MMVNYENNNLKLRQQQVERQQQHRDEREAHARAARTYGADNDYWYNLVTHGQTKTQGVDYAGPNDPAGDIEAEREGYMNGNRVYLYYRNTTEFL